MKIRALGLGIDSMASLRVPQFTLISPAVASMVVIAATFSVSAQPEVPAADAHRMSEFLHSREHLATVSAALLAFEPAPLQVHCTDVRPLRGRSWEVIERPIFEGTALVPKTAIWQETWDVSVCGRPERRNLAFAARSGQEIVPIPMFPGDSLANIAVQREAGPQAIAMAARGWPSCAATNVQIIGSTITDRAEYSQGRWAERWTAAGCNKTADIDVKFSRGADGRLTYTFTTVAGPGPARLTPPPAP